MMTQIEMSHTHNENNNKKLYQLYVTNETFLRF